MDLGRFPILPVRSSQSQSDWMVNVSDPCSGLSTDILLVMSIHFDWETQGDSETFQTLGFFRSNNNCPDCVGLRSGWNFWGRVHTGEGFLQHFLHLSLIQFWPVSPPLHYKAPQYHDGATTMLHQRNRLLMSNNLVFARRDSKIQFFSHHTRQSFSSCPQSALSVCNTPFIQEWLPSGHSIKKAWLMGYLWDGWLSYHNGGILKLC